TSIQDTAKNVTAYKERLTESPATLLQAMQTYEKFQEQVIRVATYANLKINTDGGDPTNQENAAKIAATMAKTNAELSFIESELLATDQRTIEQYLRENTDLETYRVMLEDILAKKDFTLSPETEEVIAALSEVHSAPYMIYQR